MVKQTIDIGGSPNDGSGDPLRTAFDKTNSNFNEVYTDLETIPDTLLDLNIEDGANGQILSTDGSGSFTFIEHESTFKNSPAFDIANTDITDWNTAYSWGDHGSEDYIKQEETARINIVSASNNTIVDYTSSTITSDLYTSNGDLVIRSLSGFASANTQIEAGAASISTGGSTIVKGGAATGASNSGGNVIIEGGASTGGQSGLVTIGENNTSAVNIKNVDEIVSAPGDNLNIVSRSSNSTNAIQLSFGYDVNDAPVTRLFSNMIVSTSGSITFQTGGTIDFSNANITGITDLTVGGTATIINVLNLAPLFFNPSPSEGMIAVADGINWDPIGGNSSGNKQLVVYLDGQWRKIAGAE